MRLVVLFALIISCSINKRAVKNFSGVHYYRLQDPSGIYILKRELAESKRKIHLRQQILKNKRDEKPLEKSITISEVGVLNGKKSVRPVISQFSIWFEKNKYFSQFKINKKQKKLDLVLKSPESRWNKTRGIKFKKGTVFCWISQIPECLRKAELLKEDKSLKLSFKVIWESYPYYTEQYKNLSSNVFSSAIITYDGIFKDHLKYLVQVDNQLIVYHLSQDLEFRKMFWVSQGISLVKL